MTSIEWDILLAYPFNEFGIYRLIFMVAIPLYVLTFYAYKKPREPYAYGFTALVISVVMAYGVLLRNDENQLVMHVWPALVPVGVTLAFVVIGIKVYQVAENENDQTSPDTKWHVFATISAWIGKPIMYVLLSGDFGWLRVVMNIILFVALFVLILFIGLRARKNLREGQPLGQRVRQRARQVADSVLADGDTAANQQANDQGTPQSSGGSNPPPSST